MREFAVTQTAVSKPHSPKHDAKIATGIQTPLFNFEQITA